MEGICLPRDAMRSWVPVAQLDRASVPRLEPGMDSKLRIKCQGSEPILLGGTYRVPDLRIISRVFGAWWRNWMRL